MGQSRITAILVTYRSRPTIGASLHALHPCHQRGDLVDCVVVDNASDDGTAEAVRAEHPWVTVIDAGANLGFGRANNLGLAQATGDYVLFLNPDAVLEQQELARLVDFLDATPRAGLVGPAIANSDGKPQESYSFPTPTNVVRDACGSLPTEFWPVSIAAASAPRRVDWICGAVMLARKQTLDALGGFDARFFLYFEETDLCYRAHLAGVETWVIGTAQARHSANSSARTTRRPLYRGCIADHYFRSRYYYLAKHYGRLRATGAEVVDLGIAIARALLGFVRQRGLGSDQRIRLRAPFLRTPRQHE